MVLDFDTYIFETLLDEGLLITYPANKVVGYIQKKYKLGDDDVDISYDEFTDYILISKDIKNNGLIPHSKNHRFDYPDRIYFVTNREVDEKPYFIKELCRQLYNQVMWKIHKDFLRDIDSKKDYIKRTKPNTYSIYKIDFNKLKDIELYRDPNCEFESYYTYDNINPNIIEKIDTIEL